MRDKIIKNLRDIDSLLITEQYVTMLEIVTEIQALLNQEKNESNIGLGRQILNKIHELRYKLAYNKATELGDCDLNLKKAYQTLDTLIKSA